jgi:DNA polymerase III subunit chi
MTDIAFHFNAPGKVSYACKLLRKATGSGARVAVLAPPELLTRLDQELWTFSALDFVAHTRTPCSPGKMARSAVLLCEDATQAEGFGVLVNLSATAPESIERFERLIEVVTPEEADRQAARTRWKHYTTLGYQITRHDLQLATS